MLIHMASLRVSGLDFGIGSEVGLEIGTNDGNGLGLWDGTTL